ncbi:hypothetical protein IAT38_001398 [Cryptococcus sp. DSM 104549]
MPSTYPSQYKHAKPAKMPSAFNGVITGAGHSSVYLTPVQEERILNWREGAETPVKPMIKSAPASVDVSLRSKSSGGKSGGGASGTVCTCTCTCGGMGTDCPACGSPPTSCGCSVHSPRSKSSRKSKKSDQSPNANVKGYYSSKRTASSSNMTTTLPAMMTVRPRTPPPGRRPPVLNMTKANMYRGDKKGMPSPEQLEAYRLGSPPPPQFGGAPMVLGPEREAAVPEQPQPPPPLPRIAGARDPMSTNYWRQMFPPAAGGMPIFRAGIHPPQAFGMPAGGAFGF